MIRRPTDLKYGSTKTSRPDVIRERRLSLTTTSRLHKLPSNGSTTRNSKGRLSRL